MTSAIVPSEESIMDRLRELGFTETDRKTETGRFWKHDESGSHILVPKSLDGLYPDWLFDKFLQQAEKIAGRLVNTWPGWIPRPD